MGKKYTTESLKEEIKLLEVRHAEEGRLLKQQLITTYDSLNPVTFIKDTLNQISTTPDLRNSLIDTLVGIATGFITKKMIVGQSQNRMLRYVALLVQYGITTVVARNFESIKNSVILFLQQYFGRKRETPKPASGQ